MTLLKLNRLRKQAQSKCGVISKRKNAKKILQARNQNLLVQKRRMLTFHDKNGIF